MNSDKLFLQKKNLLQCTFVEAGELIELKDFSFVSNEKDCFALYVRETVSLGEPKYMVLC